MAGSSSTRQPRALKTPDLVLVGLSSPKQRRCSRLRVCTYRAQSFLLQQGLPSSPIVSSLVHGDGPRSTSDSSENERRSGIPYGRCRHFFGFLTALLNPVPSRRKWSKARFQL